MKALQATSSIASVEHVQLLFNAKHAIGAFDEADTLWDKAVSMNPAVMASKRRPPKWTTGMLLNRASDCGVIGKVEEDISLVHKRVGPVASSVLRHHIHAYHDFDRALKVID
jgi:hypothetical protein